MQEAVTLSCQDTRHASGARGIRWCCGAEAPSPPITITARIPASNHRFASPKSNPLPSQTTDSKKSPGYVCAVDLFNTSFYNTPQVVTSYRIRCHHLRVSLQRQPPRHNGSQNTTPPIKYSATTGRAGNRKRNTDEGRNSNLSTLSLHSGNNTDSRRLFRMPSIRRTNARRW